VSLSGVFQAHQQRSGEGFLTCGTVSSKAEQDLVGQAGQAHSLSLTGPQADLIEARQLENRGLGDLNSTESGDRIAGSKLLVALASKAHQLDACRVGNPGLASLGQFCDFGVGDRELL